ncbi:MAG: site-2 protease family protein [bacterium]
MDSILFVFKLIVLVFSVVIHEISHGFVAERFGDPTARRAGRLTLNPIKHIDLFGSIILPLLMAIIPGGVVFGWAKPVPINPRNFRNPDRDTAIVSAAGPLSNITLAFVFGIFIRILSAGPITNWSTALIGLFSIIVITNSALAIFNLVPIPPLDGSGVLFAFLPSSMYGVRRFLEQYGVIIFFAFVFFGFDLIIPIILWVFRMFSGILV